MEYVGIGEIISDMAADAILKLRALDQLLADIKAGKVFLTEHYADYEYAPLKEWLG